MTFRNVAAFAASAAAIGALVVGVSAPASAQGRHNGYYHRQGWGDNGWHRSSSYRWHSNAGYSWHSAPGYGWHSSSYGWHRRPNYAWNPGPGYSWHSWDWYNSRPYRWRRSHPYYHGGGPTIGVWIRL